MVRAVSNGLRYGALCGLALLSSTQAAADAPLRESIRQQLGDENYVLVEDRNGTRLFLFSTGHVSPIPTSNPGNETEPALAMTRMG